MKYLSIFILMFALLATKAASKSFTVADLSETILSEDCMDYCVDGICYWLVCTPFGCSVKTTPHISHNLPDFVVSSYNHPGENPFTEVKPLDETKNITDIDGGHLNSAKNRRSNSHIKFKETSIIGNPMAYTLGQSRYFCRSNVKPYEPYYLSTLDYFSWRSGLTELIYPETFTPGLKEIGKPFDSWGSIYPRQGFVNQYHDAKAAAVSAARALDIVSNGGGHIYKSAGSGDFREDGKWQMISPVKSNSCNKFGGSCPSIDDDGQYGWTAWRRYGCCIPGPGAFIGSTITGCIN